MADSTLMFTFTMENYLVGCKLYVLNNYRTFCLTSVEYGLSSALNAVGFIETLNFALQTIGYSLPNYLVKFEVMDYFSINPMACLLILVLTILMLKGIEESIMVNNIFTICIMLFYLYCNFLSYNVYDIANIHPFFLGGVSGVMRGTALCFFGYTSFE